MLAYAAGSLQSNRVKVLLTEAQAALDAGQPDTAICKLEIAAKRSPKNAVVALLMGKALLKVGRANKAKDVLQEALQLQPNHAETLSALAIALTMLGDVSQALILSAEAFQIEPEHDTATNFSRVLLKAGNYEGASQLAAYALRENPKSTLALRNRALALTGLSQYDEAIQTWRTILTYLPNDIDVCHGLASLLLQCGQMTPETWAIYQRRINWSALPPTLTCWNGENIGDRTLLLVAEQGLGDTLQFVRYVPLLAARGMRVILAVQPSLLRLLASMPGADQVVALGGVMPRFDMFCPILSLPAIFGTTLHSIPTLVPYGIFDAHREPGFLHVGLVWSGNPQFPHDSERSISPALLDCLGNIPNVVFYNLQYDVQYKPERLRIVSLVDDVSDFFDTAQRVAALDLVITVDTAMAHLAGTMGKPVWLLSRFSGCWRWLNDRTDTPWYPTIRIFRQSQPNDWTLVLKQVHHDLLTVSGSIESDADVFLH